MSDDGIGAGQILSDVHRALTRYVVLPHDHAAVGATLFIAATHAQEAWEHATRLVVKSPVKRCGKTRFQEVAAELCYHPIRTANVSPAALVRCVGLDPPTIILDEADTVFATRRGSRSEAAEDIRGLLNAGHARGAMYLRWDVRARRLDECSTFAMAIIGGIDDLPDTIEDRAVVISMRRRAPGEHVAQFRARRAKPALHALRDQMAAWVHEHLDALHEAEPELPVEDRAADVWEPLVAIADLAGGEWPDLAREACIAMTGVEATDEADSVRLLTDVFMVFDGAGVDRMATEKLLAELNAAETSPWGGWHRGDGMTGRDLARMLRPYGVSPTKVRIGEASLRGYMAESFDDGWSHYVPAYRAPERNQRNEGNSPGRDVPDVAAVPHVCGNGTAPSLATESGVVDFGGVVLCGCGAPLLTNRSIETGQCERCRFVDMTP